MTIHEVDLNSGIFHMRVEVIGQFLMRHHLEMTEDQMKEEFQETLEDWGYHDTLVTLVSRVDASLEVTISSGERSKQFFIGF